jgi:DHA2 family multidrug resistance protein-like MFS transporter
MILAVASWPWLFLVNAPIGAVALYAARFLPHTPRAQHKFDYASALLYALAIGLLVIAVDGIGHREAGTDVALEFAGALVFGAALFWREIHRPWPLVPVDLLRIRVFALSVATSICSFVGQMLAYVSLPFYLQIMLGRSQVASGLLMTPWPLATAIVAPIAGRLSDRYPAGALGGLGLAIFAVGLTLLALLPPQPSDSDIIWRMMVCGAGFGFFQAPNNRAIISAAPPERSGGASGMLGTSRLAGQTMGAALVALVFGLFDLHGTAIALGLAAAIAAVAAGISALRLAGRDATPAAAPASGPR